MLNDEKSEWFECLKTFSHLNGREKQEIIRGDNPDARIAKFQFRDRVKHNWPSQWHTRYKWGYIEFENRKKFDLANQTIGGMPAFLFPITPEIDILWRRQILENRIKRSMNEMTPNDRLAAGQLVQELAGPSGDIQSFGRSASLALLSALSLSELEGLAGLFHMPSDKHGSASPAAAYCVVATPPVSASDPSPVPLPAGESAGARHPLPKG